jgi:uncharacterized protein (TIGR00725 family)
MKVEKASAPPPAKFTVGVMGSGQDEHDDLARPLGELLASLGVNLLTGGGRGVMTSVSRAFTGATRSTGISIGIIPCLDAAHRNIPKPGYPNPYVELPVFTHLSATGTQGWENLSRNHINILNSNVIIALPGGPGTASEIDLALAYGRPVMVYESYAHRAVDIPSEIQRVRSVADVASFILQCQSGRLREVASRSGRG